MTPVDRRTAADRLRESYPVSAERVCGLIGLERSSYYYRPKKRDDGSLRKALKKKAAERRRFGYRRLQVMLRREGCKVNHKRIYRIYREEGLQIAKRKRKQTAKWRGEFSVKPQRANERWSMDFVQDSLAGGRRIRILNVADDFTRECLAAEVDTSLPGLRVTRVLDRIIERRGKPDRLVMDNGPEFAGKALDAWACGRGIRLEFIEPGKPVQNAYMESFNGRMRDECLNDNWFISLKHAREIIEAWRIDYNCCRPHSSLDNRTPAEYAEMLCAG